MRKTTVLSMNTLNGVMQAPGGPEEDESGVFKYGGWSVPYGDEVSGNVVQKEPKQSADYLLGRKAFDIWNSFMPKHRAIWLSMKRVFKGFNVPKSVLIIAMLLFTVFNSNAQQSKPADSGYAPVNGIKVYYEVYGEGKPIVLLHGAFMTIEGNWSQLIQELSKTRKVIAIEFQGHGHTQFSDRKLSHTTLASDVSGVMDYLKIESADVAGYSMGGSVAYQFAIQSPKRVKKLVIISSKHSHKIKLD